MNVTTAIPPVADRSQASTDEGFVWVDGVEMYRIADYDRMPAFLMTVVSDSDLWMFLSSRGGLTAGRVDADRALFPYETDDKLHRCHPFTGPVTLLRVKDDGGEVTLWEPFRDAGARAAVTRNLYKSVLGNRVVFEEIHHELGMTFRYQWAGSDAFGMVRSATLENHGGEPVSVELLDGVLNVIPAGLSQVLTQRMSCLTNAYARAEVDSATGLAVYAMSSRIADQAEPAEALWANVVWGSGLANGRVILDDDALEAFRNSGAMPAASELKGRRAAYLVHAGLTLEPGAAQAWDLVADVHRSQAQAVALRERLNTAAGEDLADTLREALVVADTNLTSNIASADGLQCSADRGATAHHFANVLFNNMRGGVFVDGYNVPGEDFAGFVEHRNRAVAQRNAAWLAACTGELDHRTLLAEAAQSGDADLHRLALEYLPITFSRRHGDPSRPWNRFAIRLKDERGAQLLSYEGNWRDIFQNWESMCVSFPAYFECIVAKFVNASTADGFNPYRVTRDGIDWERPDPEDPWASIGYWGDHQIVYLLRLLEHAEAFYPGRLASLLGERVFTYADVPYRLRSYAELCENPHDTIDFDDELDRRIAARACRVGADGNLLHDANDKLVRVTLAEKLLVPALSKLSNLVVDGGIWMNTQRPEWNDANNALVGHGMSMVTLCYLRRYAAQMIELFGRDASAEVALSEEVAGWLDVTAATLNEYAGALNTAAVSDADRRRVLDALGEGFSTYRARVYAAGVGPATTRPAAAVVDLFTVALSYLDHAIDANRRESGLYHAYNLLALTGEGGDAAARVDHLSEMLEGQVAVLSTGRLSGAQSAELVGSLYGSALYRADQHSFLLYPNRRLAGFFERNAVDAAAAGANPLLADMLKRGDTRIVERDAQGVVRFHGDFTKAAALDAALTQLADDSAYTDAVAAQRDAVLALYEQTFNHRAFTGRSGGMYGYEGLGCIYWHMVSKLLLATQESYFRAVESAAPDTEVAALASAYYRVRSGLSSGKTAREYGAFPTDPYSHTPGHRGAQQPGMTGQVKEEILTRLGELGVRIAAGQIAFRPTLLRRNEFLTERAAWSYVDPAGVRQALALPAGSLVFTYAQVPVVYTLTDAAATTVTLTGADGTRRLVAGDRLDAATSAALFGRDGTVQRIDVAVPQGLLLDLAD